MNYVGKYTVVIASSFSQGFSTVKKLYCFFSNFCWEKVDFRIRIFSLSLWKKKKERKRRKERRQDRNRNESGAKKAEKLRKDRERRQQKRQNETGQEREFGLQKEGTLTKKV